MKYEFTARTDCGRVRGNNEDAVCVNVETQVAVLADGMGGYNAGEVASRMATEMVNTEMARWLAQAPQPLDGADVRQALGGCIANANQAILLASRANPAYQGMGTTFVASVFFGQRVLIAHVGDSRGYRLRNGQLQQLTRDHSWLQEQIDAGLMSAQEAAQSGQRNLVTRALGVEETMEVEFNEFPVEPHDLYLLCSDGLSEMLSASEISVLTNAQVSLEDRANRLIDAANARGGRDNISVVLVQAGDAPARRGLISRLMGL